MIGWFSTAIADDVLTIDGAVDVGGLDHVFVPFEVPAGVQEIEVRLDDGSEANILDWGVDDPNGHRGWGGGNTEPAVIGERAASRSYAPGPLPAGTWSVVIGKAKIVEAPAEYTITVTLRDAPTLAPQLERQPYVHAEPLEVGARWYVGDLHVHSSESGDADADFDAIAAAARSAGVDFVVLTDHNVVTQADYLVAAQSRHPDVLFVPGIEVTTYQGHAGAIGAATWVDHRLGQPVDGGVVDVDRIAAAIDDQGAVMSVHHPVLDLGSLCIGCAWELEVPAGVAAVEIANSGWEPTGQLFTRPSIEYWETLAAGGRRLAAVGGSDDHRAGAGTSPFDTPIGTSSTAVWAEALSVPALVEAIRAGATQVLLEGPTSPRVTVHASPVEGGAVVSATVDGGGDALVLFVDGVEVERAALPLAAGAAEWMVPVETGERRARLEVWQGDHPVTVTSHVWLAPEPASPGDAAAAGCGCAGARPSGGLVPLSLWWLWCRRRSGCVTIGHPRQPPGVSPA